jgi:hypothetical protein
VSTLIRRRLLALIVVPFAALAATTTAAAARTYGALIVRNDAPPSAMLTTSFAHVRPSGSFLFVVTEPVKTPLRFRWSIRCASANGRENGGASGAAAVANGHWVKRVGVTWIKHPASCSGNVEGSTSTSPVLVRVFAAG